jgi:oligoendopeptidase F
MVQTNHKTIEKWITDLEQLRKKEFSEIHTRLNKIETAQKEIVQGQLRTEKKVDQVIGNQEKMAQDLAQIAAWLGVQKNTTIAQQIDQIT